MKKDIQNFIEKYGENLPKEAIEDLNKLSCQSSYLDTAFDQSPCTISLIDKDGTYLNANKTMLNVLKKEKESLVGHKIGDITKDTKILDLIRSLQESPTENTKYQVVESQIDGKNKQFWISVNRVGDRFLIIGSDITDFKDLEQEKMFSDKMAFLGEMSSFIVHEINNPLMAISMANEIIQMKAKDPVVTKYSEEIETMIQTITKIIDSLKVFSRRSGEEAQSVSLQKLFDNSRIILSGKEKGMKVKIVAENLENATIQGDEVEYLQILVNLMSNSIDAVKNLEEKWVKVKWDGSALKIVDSGRGIPDSVVPNLFKKFYTSKGSKGNGIGLYLSRELLRKQGFELVYSLEEGNTSFQWKRVVSN